MINFKKNKKGVELTFETIVVFIILLLVFLVMVYFFVNHYGGGVVEVNNISGSILDQYKD
jgi:hypothetical protein